MSAAVSAYTVLRPRDDAVATVSPVMSDGMAMPRFSLVALSAFFLLLLRVRRRLPDRFILAQLLVARRAAVGTNVNLRAIARALSP